MDFPCQKYRRVQLVEYMEGPGPNTCAGYCLFSKYNRMVQETHPPAELFQLQMGLSFPFLRANDLHSSLLNIRARSF